MRHYWLAQSRNGYTGIDVYSEDGCLHGPVIVTKTKKLGQEVMYLANNAYQYGVEDTLANLVRWGYLTSDQKADIEDKPGDVCIYRAEGTSCKCSVHRG